MIGQILRGYEILEEIAKGGQGAIYLAHEQSVDRNVAIKVILPHYADKPEFKQRFEGEARLVARLEHPHIVPLYSYWQDENGAFLVMRLIKSGSLRDLIETQGALSLSHTKRILSHLTDALAFAHINSVVHRDLKPENILLDDLGNSYLTDFGIAKQINQPSNLTATDGIMGSWKYLSPEQIQSNPVTPQTDIYALGVMLYEMLAGEHPFKDAAATMLIMRHLQDTVPDIRDKRPDLPDALDSVIQTATAKEQAQRYSDVPAFLEAFEQAITSPIIAQSPQTLTPIAPSKPITIEERNREAILQNVRTFWIEGVLEQSLYKAVRIELGMSEVAEAVDNPWQTVLKMPQSSDETLPQGTTILDIFERLQGKLLILGDPGSGKTTTLLELTRDLLNRAEVDSAHPIPVVFNLSSWAENRKPLAEWMIDELNTKYQVPRKIGTTWVEAEQILPLLDGLDEVAADHRDACVEIINTYRGEHGFVDVVVCSRIADYEALTNKLRLNGAIVLQPLQRAQVDEYLQQMGHELDAVRQVLEDDKLRQLTTSPLMLNILILAYRGVDIAEIPMFDSLEGRRKHLFETYVNRMLERRKTNERYSAAKTKKYLARIARQMSEEAQSVFYIEFMQPQQFLKTKLSQYLFLSLGYFLLILNILIISSVPIISISIYLSNILILIVYLGFMIIMALLFCVVSPILAYFSLREFHNINKTPLSIVKINPYPTAWTVRNILLALWDNEGRRLRSFAFLLICLLPIFFAFNIENQTLKFQIILSGVLMFGIGFWINIGVSMGFQKGVTPLIKTPNQAFRRISLLDFIHPYSSRTLSIIGHTTLRIIVNRLGILPFNLADFLDYASERILMRRVGGGYIFIHRLLLDYFAHLDDKYDDSERIDRLSDGANRDNDSHISDADEDQDIMQI